MYIVLVNNNLRTKKIKINADSFSYEVSKDGNATLDFFENDERIAMFNCGKNGDFVGFYKKGGKR